jgi:hypothetical protein
MTQDTDDNDRGHEFVVWQFRAIDAAAAKKPKHNPMGEGGVVYLNPPNPYVHYIMVEFGHTRQEAEFIASIT